MIGAQCRPGNVSLNEETIPTSVNYRIKNMWIFLWLMNTSSDTLSGDYINHKMNAGNSARLACF